MTVPISGMTRTFANSSIRYDAIGMDVNAFAQAANSTLINLKANGNSVFIVELSGNTTVNGTLYVANSLIVNENVGIGTKSPQYTFDVNGTINTNAIISNTLNIKTSNVTTAIIADANIITSNIAAANIISANITAANIIMANISSANIASANISNANITTANIGIISLVNQPIWQGYLFANNVIATDYTPNSVTQFSTGIQTVYTTTNTAIVIPANGIYQVHAQQLMSSGTNGLYLHIRKNINTVAYAYMPGLTSTIDMIVSSLVQCNVGDIIDFYIQGNTTTTWGTPHSSVYIKMIA